MSPRRQTMHEMVNDHELVLYGTDDTDDNGLIDRVKDIEKTHEYVQDIRNRMRQIVWGVIALILTTVAVDWFRGDSAPSTEDISKAVVKALKEKP